jgi:hypothetical protein
MDNSGRSSNHKVKLEHVMFHMKRRFYWELDKRSFMLHSGKELTYILSMYETLDESEFKDERLINGESFNVA